MNTLNHQSGATTIHIRVDKVVKSEAEELFKNMGISISSAVNMFFRQALAEQAIPFQPKVREKTLPAPRKSLEKRIENFVGTFEYEEWDTGTAVGSEVIQDVYS